MSAVLGRKLLFVGLPVGRPPDIAYLRPQISCRLLIVGLQGRFDASISQIRAAVIPIWAGPINY